MADVISKLDTISLQLGVITAILVMTYLRKGS